MQEKMIDGSYGEPVPFDKDKMEESLENPEVSHVEVFPGTEENLKNRRELIESKRRKNRKRKSKLQRKSRKRN